MQIPELLHRCAGNKSLGVSLPELLLALLILGNIAAFSIPKVLSAQENQRKQVVFKESIAAVYNLYPRSRLQGKTHGEFLSYLEDNLNYTRKGINSPTNGWFELHNGARVYINIGGHVDLGVDWNGITKGANLYGDDELVMFILGVSDCGRPPQHLVPNSPTCGGYGTPAQKEAMEALFYSLFE